MLTAKSYFFDKDWRYYEIILGFDEVLGNHTGKHLYESVTRSLEECGLTLEQVSAITADNASNNTTLFNSMEDALRRVQRNYQHTIIRRVPCLAHIIQLASNAILGKISEKRELYPETVPERLPAKERGPVDTVQKVSTLI